MDFRRPRAAARRSGYQKETKAEAGEGLLPTSLRIAARTLVNAAQRNLSGYCKG